MLVKGLRIVIRITYFDTINDFRTSNKQKLSKSYVVGVESTGLSERPCRYIDIEFNSGLVTVTVTRTSISDICTQWDGYVYHQRKDNER
jgi:hypothetical protein